jgi:hypothetical protein
MVFVAHRAGAAAVVTALFISLGAGAAVAPITAGVSLVAIALIGAVFWAVIIATDVLQNAAVKYRWSGLLLFLFSLGMIVVCLCAARFLPLFLSSQATGPFCCS